MDEQIITMEIEKHRETIVIVKEFYDRQSDVLIHVNRSKDIYLLRDFNAKVGKKLKDSVVGKCGEGKVNNNGEWLIELSEIFQTKIMYGFSHEKLYTNIYRNNQR